MLVYKKKTGIEIKQKSNLNLMNIRQINIPRINDVF